MLKDPQGQKRPAYSIEAAVMVTQIATGEVKNAKVSGRHAYGLAGAKARVDSLSPSDRSKMAQAAAKARWKK